MSYHHSNRGGGVEFSGDERETPSGGDGRIDSDLYDKPMYLLEHLATFTVNKESGIVFPADGMRRLLQLEKTTGIWSQKMQLCLDCQWVLIMDYETGNIIERFPATLIQEPSAFTSTDAMELYNNILVFIVSGGNGSRSEMHIFQSQSVSAVHLVEDLKNLRSGKMVTQQRESSLQQHQQQKLKSEPGIAKPINAASTLQIQITDHHHAAVTMTATQQRSINQFGMRGAGGGAVEISHAIGDGGGETDSEYGVINDETSSTSSDKYERDVTVLNHCFDDIEKFIARLQHAAAASRELERRRRNRKTKKKDLGDGLLTLRTRLPQEKEFIDIFAKFKLSFNLLAKLKAHIHDPNAPELVHFLFTPLALIVEASSDTYYESQLPGRVINPLLTREAINLLINCVTSKETELWRSLGDAWIIPRDQWKEDVGSYHPIFLDGWSPDYLVIDELETPTTPTNINKRGMEIAQTYHHHYSGGHNMGGGLNGRGIVGDTALMINGAGGSGGFYDDYDSSAIALNEKYTIHHGQTEGRERGESTPTGGSGNIAGVDFSTRSEISIDSIERSGFAGHNVSGNGGAAGQTSNVLQSITAGMQNLDARNIRSGGGSGVGAGAYGIGNSGSKSGLGVSSINAGLTQLGVESGGGASPNSNDNHMLEAWLEAAQASGAKIVLVTYPRTANNDKELSVVRGEYLEIIDDTRKWWKARNMRGQIGHVPHTIVTAHNYGDTESSNQFYGPQSNHISRLVGAASVDQNEQRSNDTTDWVRNKHLGKKGEFRYF